MKLIELNPKYGSEENIRSTVIFDCPKCKGHKIAVPIPPHPKAWTITGNSFDNLTLHPSIDHNNGTCHSHFFVRNGEIQMA